MGTNSFHLERVRGQYTWQHDPLWRHQDHADRFGAWLGGDHDGHQCHRQLHSGGTDLDGRSLAEIEANFFNTERPGSLLRRFARAEEVANLVLYYASPLSSATNGAAIRVDGGVVRSIL